MKTQKKHCGKIAAALLAGMILAGPPFANSAKAQGDNQGRYVMPEAQRQHNLQRAQQQQEQRDQRLRQQSQQRAEEQQRQEAQRLQQEEQRRAEQRRQQQQQEAQRQQQNRERPRCRENEVIQYDPRQGRWSCRRY